MNQPGQFQTQEYQSGYSTQPIPTQQSPLRQSPQQVPFDHHPVVQCQFQQFYPQDQTQAAAFFHYQQQLQQPIMVPQFNTSVVAEVLENSYPQQTMIATAGGGFKPLYVAGQIYYQQYLLPAIERTVMQFEKAKNDKDKSKSLLPWRFVNLPDLHNVLNITLDDGSVKSYRLDNTHYAPRKKDGKFTDRDFTAWSKMGTLSPFRSAQNFMKSRGYYLVEESDPSKGKKVIVKLYSSQSPYPATKLWHDHNKIHGIYTPQHITQQMQSEQSVQSVQSVQAVQQEPLQNGSAQRENCERDILLGRTNRPEKLRSQQNQQKGRNKKGNDNNKNKRTNDKAHQAEKEVEKEDKKELVFDESHFPSLPKPGVVKLSELAEEKVGQQLALDYIGKLNFSTENSSVEKIESNELDKDDKTTNNELHNELHDEILS